MVVSIFAAVYAVPCTLLFIGYLVNFYNVSKRCSEHHLYFLSKKTCIPPLHIAKCVSGGVQHAFLLRYGNSIT